MNDEGTYYSSSESSDSFPSSEGPSKKSDSSSSTSYFFFPQPAFLAFLTGLEIEELRDEREDVTV